VTDTCHFSATCDISTIILFVHWASMENGVLAHHMEEIDDLSLKKARDMSIFRTFMRNLQDHALGVRLTNIRSAVPKVTAALAKRPWLLPMLPPESTAASAADSVSVLDSGSSAQLPVYGTVSASGSTTAGSTPILPLLPPPTPISNAASNSNSASPPPKRTKTQAFGDGT
jgi:hypothetical protein